MAASQPQAGSATSALSFSTFAHKPVIRFGIILQQ
jgi:hypothetical protein